MKIVLATALALAAALAPAHAALQTVGGVTFDDSNGATEVRIAQGGHSVGPPSGWRSVGDLVPEATGVDLTTSWEINSNGTAPDDILSFLFDSPIMNGAGNCVAGDYSGCDVLIFERFNQADNPTLSLTLGGTTILGVLLGQQGTFGDHIAVWGYDLSGLGIAIGDLANNPLFVGRDVGTPDIAAMVGMYFEDPAPEIPVPAAAPLFFAGLAGLAFARRKRRKA